MMNTNNTSAETERSPKDRSVMLTCPHGECMIEEGCPDCEMEDPIKYHANLAKVHEFMWG